MGGVDPSMDDPYTGGWRRSIFDMIFCFDGGLSLCGLILIQAPVPRKIYGWEESIHLRTGEHG